MKTPIDLLTYIQGMTGGWYSWISIEAVKTTMLEHAWGFSQGAMMIGSIFSRPVVDHESTIPRDKKMT